VHLVGHAAELGRAAGRAVVEHHDGTVDGSADLDLEVAAVRQGDHRHRWVLSRGSEVAAVDGEHGLGSEGLVRCARSAAAS
jgi:hypothetical protein